MVALSGCSRSWFCPLRSAIPPSSEPSRFSGPVLFAALVAAALFPMQRLDPAWQLRLDLRQAVAGAAWNAALEQPGQAIPICWLWRWPTAAGW